MLPCSAESHRTFAQIQRRDPSAPTQTPACSIRSRRDAARGWSFADAALEPEKSCPLLCRMAAATTTCAAANEQIVGFVGTFQDSVAKAAAKAMPRLEAKEKAAGRRRVWHWRRGR